MKRQWKGFMAGIMVSMLTVGIIGTAAATVGSKSVTLNYNNIKVTLDGKQVELSDANGSAVEPFTINGTTYLPVRAVANALGLDVGWDGTTNTVILTTPKKTDPILDDQPKPNEESMTVSQKNALRKAESYLNFMAFSYSGLVKQLEYEKFSHEDAVFAADHCGADWFEQAAKKAESYLNFMGFSKEKLIEQLEYEGFTHEQAVYGAEKSGY